MAAVKVLPQPLNSVVDAMGTRVERLEFWKQIAQIVSALAIPVVLALIGFFVQRSLADAGLKKDYVQMALGVLNSQPTKENEQLREWAISVLDKNSPVPIPLRLKSQLARSSSIGFFTEGFRFESTVECKPVPNQETLEWLIANDPARYSRCPNGELGERKWKVPPYTKGPATAASTPAK